MENTYGIDVRNRFDLCFDDDVEDPLEILKQQEAEIQRRKNEKVSKDKPKVAKPASVVQKGKKDVISNVPPKAGAANVIAKPQEKKPATKPPGRVAPAEDRSRRTVEPLPPLEGQWDTEPRRGRGGVRGGSRGLSRGRVGGYDQRGKREFDRQSGSIKSGVKPVEKREGAGAHNWGTVTDEIQFPDSEDRSGDEATVPTGEQKEGEESAPEKAKEPEEVAMTLDEWKKQEQSKRCVPSYNLRKPGEGEDKKWGKVYLLKKKEIDEEEDEEEEYEDEENIRRGRQKQHLDIEIKFRDLNMRGGRGRGRGFGRGGRGSRNAPPASEPPENRPAANPSQLPAPKVDDFNDFPSLTNT